MNLKGRHFLTVGDFKPEEIEHILEVATSLKQDNKIGREHLIMRGKTLATIFEKPSLRTRVSFDVGFMELGGNVINLRKEEINICVREPIKDCARNLSRYVSCMMIRTFAHSNIEEIAKYSSVPVINGLTDKYHPCQAMADILTVKEKFKTLKGIKMTYIGDGNNVAHSLLLGGALTGMEVTTVSPGGYKPAEDVVAKAQKIAKTTGAKIKIETDPKKAVAGAQAIYTDVWASMGQEEEAEERKKVFKQYQLNMDLLKLADSNCIAMHCLPAHRDEEITDEVFELHADNIFNQAENRLHAQKAIMACIIPN